MRKYKPRRPIHLQCVDCPAIFTAYNSNALRCPECREAAKLKQQRQHYRQEAEVKRKKYPKMSIKEVLIALEKYNREHKTHLSYGQFVQQMEAGKIW